MYGIDIDKRAYQLAYFAVMMKARRYDRRFLTKDITPNLAHTDCSFDTDLLQQLGSDKIYNYFKNCEDAELLGSLVNAANTDFDNLIEYMQNYDFFEIETLDRVNLMNDKENIIRKLHLYKFLAQKYHVVITNPPYMGTSGMNAKLSDYVKVNYPDSKSDLFAVFIERCLQMTKSNFYTAMITQHAFMFLSSYEKLRSKLLLNNFVNMAHLGTRAFEEIGGEVVQTASFVMSKQHISNYEATYVRLVDFNSQQAKEDAFLSGKNRHRARQDTYSFITGQPIAYWLFRDVINLFQTCPRLGEYYNARVGLMTTDNDRFLRYFWEVNNNHVCLWSKSDLEARQSGKKWFPHNKGGAYRKWAGNYDYVVDWEDNGKRIKQTAIDKYPYLKGNPNFVVHDDGYYFRENISWSEIAAGNLAFRYFPSGFTFNVKGMSAFTTDKDWSLEILLGFTNSKPFSYMANGINPSMSFGVNSFNSLPIAFEENIDIAAIVQECIVIARSDWDSFETSWDFETHPLLLYRHSVSGAKEGTVADSITGALCENQPWFIKNAYEAWEYSAQLRFATLKANEEELNRVFIEIYGLQEELIPEVEDKDVTIRKADLQRDIRSLVSYAVGCMFGRYSLDVDGLVYAGGNLDDSKYSTFIPDRDNCIPITDEEYFEDDIVGLFIAFVKKVYGIETLEETLDFIAKALGICRYIT